MIEVKCAYDEMVSVKKLIPNSRNPNKHPKKQIEMLARIIEVQGWRAPITVSSRSGFIVRGHGRFEAARLLKCREVPVDFQDYGSDQEEWADLVADNKIAELAETDDEMLKQLLQETGSIDFLAEVSGIELEQIQKILNPPEAENSSLPKK